MSDYNQIISVFNKMNVAKLRDKFTTCSLKLLKSMKNEFDNRYYCTGEETLDDLRYDILVEVLEEREPGFCVKVGGKLRDGDNKTNLPFLLAGMDKIKKGEDSKLANWKQKHTTESYIISDKLNGVSCLIVCKSGKLSLYTRGDKEKGEGSDISYLQDKIKGIPKLKEDIAIRGEIILTIESFENTWSKAYKNSLALIVSVVNSKTLKEPVKDLRFIAYEIVVEGQAEINLEEQMRKLTCLGFETPAFNIVSDFTSESLSEHLQARKDTTEYDIDGLVVCVNGKYNRHNTTATGNPDYAFAFKMLLEVATAEVVNVEWRASRWGTLIPRICVKPVKLRGITIEHSTGFHAAYIRDNNINVGSKLLITRSGDVIPYIVKVLTQSSEPLFPSTPFVWNETNVDITCANNGNDIQIQKLIHFFVALGVKQINEGVIKKLYENGFDTIEKILRCEKKDFMKVPTFQTKMSERLTLNISDALKSVELADIMVASCAFGNGLGKKKIMGLLKVFPNILNDSLSVEQICKVQGFSDKSAKKVLDGVCIFKQFFEPIKEFVKLKEGNVVKGDKFQGKKFVFSGFRDNTLKTEIESFGGIVTDSVSSKTYAVIVKDKDEVSSKLTKARELNVKIITKMELN